MRIVISQAQLIRFGSLPTSHQQKVSKQLFRHKLGKMSGSDSSMLLASGLFEELNGRLKSKLPVAGAAALSTRPRVVRPTIEEPAERLAHIFTRAFRKKNHNLGYVVLTKDAAMLRRLLRTLSFSEIELGLTLYAENYAKYHSAASIARFCSDASSIVSDAMNETSSYDEESNNSSFEEDEDASWH